MKKKSLLMLLVVALVLLVSITAVACKPETVAVTGVITRGRFERFIPSPQSPGIRQASRPT